MTQMSVQWIKSPGRDDDSSFLTRVMQLTYIMQRG
jgi:hypothetical protein